MKIAVIGSRVLTLDLSNIIPTNATEIISGGARGIDTCAKIYANQHNIKLTTFLPDYSKYNKRAPLVRNKHIIENCDKVVAVWDGLSTGTLFAIKYAYQLDKPIKLLIPKDMYPQCKPSLNFLDYYEYTDTHTNYAIIDDIDLEFAR